MRIFADQLVAQHLNHPSTKGSLRHCYLITGTEPLLVEESEQAIRQKAKALGFSEHDYFSIEPHTDWEAIFSLCEGLSLFSEKRSITLQFSENGINASITEHLLHLAKLIHDDLLLIFRLPKFTKAQENSKWFKALFVQQPAQPANQQAGHPTSQQTTAITSVIVTCVAPTRENLPRFVSQRTKALGINCDDVAVQQLCYHYEGNLLALVQLLQQLSLLFGNEPITGPKLSNLLQDSAHFTPYHWVDALLMGKAQRAFHILQQLEREEFEVIILIRALQQELLQLIQMQQRLKTMNIRQILDEFKVWQNRRPLVTQALQHISHKNLVTALNILCESEISAKQDYSANIWQSLLNISLILCNKTILSAQTFATQSA